ncbi:hypothetical protein HPTD01_2986 [Halomonas sp. TD01]|nr:hypothetical protein HPTD01_2986 [Halomonas sp. TD01]
MYEAGQIGLEKHYSHYPTLSLLAMNDLMLLLPAIQPFE